MHIFYSIEAKRANFKKHVQFMYITKQKINFNNYNRQLVTKRLVDRYNNMQ